MAEHTPFEWKHIEQHHYECHWHGFRLSANQDGWRVEYDGFIRCGHPRIQRGAKVSAERRAKVARQNAEGYAYRRFYERPCNEQ